MGAVHIGFSVNEMLCLATVATGLVWLSVRRHASRGGRLPTWGPWTAELFLVVALVFGCRVAVADWPRVPSASMEPTLRPGDVLLVNHWAYGPRLPFTNTALPFGRPQRGDVVVFRYPRNVSEFYVKRLVGLPGDRVVFRDGMARIDGVPVLPGSVALLAGEEHGQWLLHEALPGRDHLLKINPFVQGRLPLDLSDPGLAAHCRSEGAAAWECTVPAGQYLMLGDNRDDSADSRVWGFLPEGEVYGKAVRVLFNPTDLGRAWTAL